MNFLSRQTKVSNKGKKGRRKSSNSERRSNKIYDIDEIEDFEHDCSRGYNDGCDAPALGGVQAFYRRHGQRSRLSSNKKNSETTIEKLKIEKRQL